jgi:ubiquinone/menaquinone biosynthesis C-methylase UbiE
MSSFIYRKSSRILELGCGDGSLWANNMDRIPDGFDITLTDFSEGMLMDAKKKLEPQIDKFKFKLVDAETIPFEDESFDAVIANHMLYHVQDIEKVFSEIKRVLKKGGYFYASTVGRNHMAEMRQIVNKFDSKLITTKSFDYTQKFQLENGKEQVSKWFKEVRLKRYEDNLIVTEPGPLIDYIFSMPGNVKTSFDEEKLNKLYSFLQNEINKNNGIFISKDTGFFEARRN